MHCSVLHILHNDSDLELRRELLPETNGFRKLAKAAILDDFTKAGYVAEHEVARLQLQLVRSSTHLSHKVLYGDGVLDIGRANEATLWHGECVVLVLLFAEESHRVVKKASHVVGSMT